MEQAGTPWRVSAPELAELLGLELVELYRRAYEAQRGSSPPIGLSSAADGFDQENVVELLRLLELFHGAQAEPALAGAGVFLPHEHRLEIIETFLSLGAAEVAGHVVDRAEFAAMLRALGRYETARDEYLREHFSVEGMVERAVESYCASHPFGIPSLGRRNVRGIIELYFARHVLSAEAILGGCIVQLLEQARREGYVRAAAARGGPKRARAGERQRPAGDTEGMLELRASLAALDLRSCPMGSEELRARYRALMKRYHPDLNPAGLERAKAINAAYALLLAHLRAGSRARGGSG